MLLEIAEIRIVLPAIRRFLQSATVQFVQQIDFHSSLSPLHLLHYKRFFFQGKVVSVIKAEILAV